ncbi:MAG: NosD domain-containing protein [Patescibacteria group bacterium]
MISLRDFALTSFLFVVSSVFLIANTASAQVIPPSFVLTPAGTTEGIGTSFSITDSSYLNITLDSTESVKLKLESVPEMVTMMIWPPTFSTSSTSTQITLHGFQPSTIYYRYEDNYHNLTEFKSDGSGAYSYTQDISTNHVIFIQPRHSTKFIKDDTTGGDCYLIGNWDITTKTCTLNIDLTETIQIDSDSVTLDGNGHTLTGSNTGTGVYLYGRTGVTVRNFIIKKFSFGIYLYFSSKNTIANNILSNNYHGIYLESSTGNTLTSNTTLSNNNIGIFLYSSSGNTLTSNTSLNNNSRGILLFYSSMGNMLTNNNVSNNVSGIELYYFSNNNTLTNNTTSNNYLGTYLSYSSGNTITSNTVSNNYYGIHFYYSSGNQIYNNNFINNSTQTYVSGGSGNIFNLVSPVSGNYWSDYDTPVEGCNDANSDNFCDSPYVFYGDQDNLPWITQDGWKVPVNQPPTISNILQFKSDGVTTINEGVMTAEQRVVFEATLSDIDNDHIKLQVELKESSQLFDGTNLLESSFVVSGGIATTTENSIPEGAYHWRARAVDDKGNTSAWQEFGVVGNVDFEVKVPLNIKAADLAKELLNQNYLWGGKGWDFANRLFTDTNTVKTNYKYWNPDAKAPGKGDFGIGDGVDCSGLIGWSYNRSNNPHKNFVSNFIKYESANDQYYNNVQPVAESDLQPGDLLFFDWDGNGRIDHEAMYVGESGGFDVVSAPKPGKKIEGKLKNSYKQVSGFVAFGRPKNATIAMAITKHSPIHLSVTDPDGNSVSDTAGVSTDEEYIRSSGDLMYTTIDIDPQGYPEDVAYSPVLKQGTYRIQISPMASTTPDQTYSLDFTAGSTTIPLAQNVPLSQIPVTGGYGVVVGADNSITLDTTPPEATLTFDVVTQKLNIIGTDNLSATMVSTTATSTIVADKSDNTLQIIFSKYKQGKKEIKLELGGLVYNGVLTSTIPKTTLKYEWSVDKSGNLKELEQKTTVGTLKIEAHYDAKKNTTKIKKKIKGNNDNNEDDDTSGVKETFTGLRILKLMTDKGNLTVEY